MHETTLHFRLSMSVLFVAASVLGQETRASGADEIRAFRKDYTEALMARQDPEFATSEESAAIRSDPARNPDLRFLPRAAALARKHRGIREAVETWVFVLESSSCLPPAERAPLVKEAVAAIKERVTEPWCSTAVRSVADQRAVIGATDAAAVLEAARKSTHTATVGEALLGLARLQSDRGDAAGREAAKKLLTEAAEKHGKTKDYLGAVKDRAAARMAAIDLLQVGRPLPAFEAKTADGADVSSGALKGKVVVICFWWHHDTEFLSAKRRLAALYTKSSAKGLSLIGAVTPSEPSESIVKRMKLEGVEWPQLGDPFGAELAARWAPETYGMHFVVADRKGVVRRVGFGVDAAIKAAEAALAE